MGDIRKPTVHNMKRRSQTHDYNRSGYYHITISVAKELRQPLGQMAGQLDKPDGDCNAPHVVLSPLGQMVEQELRESIQRHYPMLEVLEYIVMPEHLHFLLAAHRDIVSKSGRPTHLGQVIAGFKYGCNKRYWAMTGRGKSEESESEERPAGEKAGATPTGNEGAGPAVTGDARPAAEPPGTRGAAGSRVPGGSAAKEGAGSEGAAAQLEAPPLFESGYCDVMPIDEAQLATQRAYISANPRNRLRRMMNRSCLQPQRMCIETHLSLRALKGYLQRECKPSQITEEIWQGLAARLITKDGMIYCDRYGSEELLKRELLPVVCHQKDAHLHDLQLHRCLEAADKGAVMVSARIAKGEQAVMAAVQERERPVVIIADNGFPEIYHPSEEKQAYCAAGRLLLLTPWNYHYRKAEEAITVAECKTMNCIAQAVCRLRDDWWK